MKSKYITAVILLLFVLFGCKSRQANNESMFTAIQTEFPLVLGEIDLDDDSRTIVLDEKVSSKIDSVITGFAGSLLWEDYPHSDMDTYIGTICLPDELYTVYVVLLRGFPTTERVFDRVLFYDNRKHEFIDDVSEIGIYNLYYFNDDGKLTPSNLKTELEITSPEMELTDFNTDGINDYKITRLVHNGTYNGLLTRIVTVKDSSVDTLFLDETKPYGYVSR